MAVCLRSLPTAVTNLISMCTCASRTRRQNASIYLLYHSQISCSLQHLKAWQKIWISDSQLALIPTHHHNIAQTFRSIYFQSACYNRIIGYICDPVLDIFDRTNIISILKIYESIWTNLLPKLKFSIFYFISISFGSVNRCDLIFQLSIQY